MRKHFFGSRGNKSRQGPCQLDRGCDVSDRLLEPESVQGEIQIRSKGRPLRDSEVGWPVIHKQLKPLRP